jgi:hypothetical protein
MSAAAGSRLALPSGCRDSAPIDGTGRYPTGPNGNCFPSDFREFSAKTACALSFRAVRGDLSGACSGADLTPQQKALEFMLFDLAACVAPENRLPPAPPPPPPPPM